MFHSDQLIPNYHLNLKKWTVSFYALVSTHIAQHLGIDKYGHCAWKHGLLKLDNNCFHACYKPMNQNVGLICVISPHWMQFFVVETEFEIVILLYLLCIMQLVMWIIIKIKCAISLKCVVIFHDFIFFHQSSLCKIFTSILLLYNWY